MSAIVVTVPQSRIGYVLGDKFGHAEGYIWWSLPTFPKRKVERIYFAWDGAVRAWRNVLGFGHEGDKPSAMIGLDHHVVDPPVPMKGFQGFRYYEESREGGKGNPDA